MLDRLSKREQIVGVKSRKTHVYNPTSVIMTDEISSLSPRIDSFEGKRIGLLWNSKPNGEFFLNRVAELLSKKFQRAEIIKFWERYPNETANPDKKSDEAIDIITQNADVVISAAGD